MKKLMLGLGCAAVLSCSVLTATWPARAQVQSDPTVVSLLIQVVQQLAQIEQNTRPSATTQP